MKLIKQKLNWDCSIASIAMFTNKSYTEILKIYHKYFPKNGNDDWTAQFRQFGNRSQELTDIQVDKILRHFKIRPIALPFEFLNLKIKSIILLQSLNDKNSWHNIYCDGNNIYDPNKGKIKNGKPVKFYSELNQLTKKNVLEITINLNDVKKLKCFY